MNILNFEYNINKIRRDFKLNINNLKEQLGQKVTLGAWIANKRSSGKIAFFQLRYGAGFIQAIALKEALGEERYQQLRHLPQETSLKVTGLIKENERELSGIELEIEDFEVISEAIDYPITPKEHGVEFLADNRHIWIRSKKQHAILTIRNQIRLQFCLIHRICQHNLFCYLFL